MFLGVKTFVSLNFLKCKVHWSAKHQRYSWGTKRFLARGALGGTYPIGSGSHQTPLGILGSGSCHSCPSPSLQNHPHAPEIDWKPLYTFRMFSAVVAANTASALDRSETVSLKKVKILTTFTNHVSALIQDQYLELLWLEAFYRNLSKCG